jgi:hypothetical protein
MRFLKRMVQMVRRLIRMYREYKLEYMVNTSILTCGGAVHDEQVHKQAREHIMSGPYNPLKPRKD